MHKIKPLVLLILDGWGYRQSSEYNAIAQAKTPQWHQWLASYPHTLLEASGEAVGLPNGQIGNSEVGHMHIGAGRIIWQDFTQIQKDIQNQHFIQNLTLHEACKNCSQHHRTLHIMGLLSPGGIHAHEDHLFALLQIIAQYQNLKFALHLFLDGRDVAPQSAINSIKKLETQLQQLHLDTRAIHSICGRFYAMDRDQRWERTQETYELLCLGNKPTFPNATMAIESYYQQGITDEFIPPTVIGSQAQTIQTDDLVFFFNFRADRAIQLTESLILPDFHGFTRHHFPKIATMLTMTSYAQHLPTTSIYPKRTIKNTLGEVLEHHQLAQLRIAETEKFPHVSYFLNGGREQKFAKEERILIPSPKVKTYDLMPQMKVHEITQNIIEQLELNRYALIIANFANPDMVGHCGNFPAAVQAIEAVDQCFKQLDQALKKYHAQAIITADHGNAELMYDTTTQQNHTAHTLSPVPFVFIGKNWKISKTHGSLIDIAPTILALLDLKQPPEMCGTSLLIKNHNNE